MDKNENSSNQHQVVRCEICGGEIVEGICSECNWVPIIFPQGVPDSIKSFDSKRKEAAKKHQSDIAQLKSERDAASVRARDLETEVAKLKTDFSQAQEEVRNAQSKIQEINATNSNKLDSEISYLKSSLAQAKQEIHDAQLQNQHLTQEKEKLQAELEQMKQSNTSGVQIRIDKNDYGQYTLYVIAGVAQRSNGRVIGQSGMELHNPSFFRIGELSFKVSVPDINIDDL